jgi:hypothetical protein
LPAPQMIKPPQGGFLMEKTAVSSHRIGWVESVL